MTDQRIAAVRKVREEADKLRLACIAAAGTASLIHVAFDRGTQIAASIAEAALLTRLESMQ